jgi:hypothetical protein
MDPGPSLGTTLDGGAPAVASPAPAGLAPGTLVAGRRVFAFFTSLGGARLRLRLED